MSENYAVVLIVVGGSCFSRLSHWCRRQSEVERASEGYCLEDGGMGDMGLLVYVS